MRVLLTGGGRLHRLGRAATCCGPTVTTSSCSTGRSTRGDDVTDLDRVRSSAGGLPRGRPSGRQGRAGRRSSADIDDYVRQNDLGTAIVLRAAAEAGCPASSTPRRWWSTARATYACAAARRRGAAAAICRRPGGRPVRAASVPRVVLRWLPAWFPSPLALDPRNVYAATKAHGEQLARIWSRETAGVVAALRFHNVYGPGMPRHTPYAGVASLFRAALEQRRPAEVFEDGRQRRNFVHVTDVARAVVAAVTADLPADSRL